MTGEEREKIKEYRLKGVTYSRISDTLDIPENTVKSYCRRIGLTKKQEPKVKPTKEKHTHCKECGIALVQNSRGKPKKFCSEKCRRLWWKKNNDKHDKTSYYTIKCHECGRVFESYGKKDRKFCSHSCYINNRFERGDNDEQ